MNKKGFKLSNGRFSFLMLLPGFILIAIFTYFPLTKGITMAFQSYTLWDLSAIHFNGIDNFKEVFKDPDFGMIVLNTIKWVFFSLFFQFTLGFFLALLLKKAFPGKGVYQGLVYFPWAISGFFIGIIWRWLFNGQMGVINDILIKIGLISQPIGFLSNIQTALPSVIIANIWYGVPFFAIMIVAALKSVPDDLYEAADIDGANKLKQFFFVTLPYIKPVLVLTTLLRVIWILNFPDLIYSMTNGGPAGATHTITTYMLNMIMFDQNYGKASAVGVIIMAILLSYTVFYLNITKYEEAGEF